MDDGMISFHTRPDGQRYFTNADMARMVEQGLIDPEDRWELIEGAWYDMGSEGFEHWNLRSALLEEVILQLGRNSGFRASSEGSIYLSPDTEVRPDLIICRSGVTSNALEGEDISLIIEVMKTSHQRDREVKMPVYAATGVPELWLIDMDTRKTDCMTDPDTANRVYQSRRVVDFEEALIPGALSNISVRLTDMV